jgi:CHAT domain-containing protein/AAA ATPase-like protein
MTHLLLSASEPGTALSWRWTLTEPDGKFIDDHQICVDPAEWQYRALTGLYEWLRDNPDPDQVLAEIGDWAATRLLGRIGETLADYAPVAVLVTFPAAATALGAAPVELARVAGRSLAARGVSLVIDLPAAAPRVGNRGPLAGHGLGPVPLRVLGLFSLPDGTRTLNLRRERHELERLAGELSGRGYAIELRVLQYGTTRATLTEAAEDGDGWDVVHLLGHGGAGGFTLERSDGTADRITAGELADLVEPLRNRVRLVTVSSCRSAEAGSDSARSLAADLAGRLRCAAIGMRYPVTETFAAAFGNELYRLMFERNVPLAQARATAVRTATAGPPTPARPAVSAGAPALYGRTALDLRLPAPATGAPLEMTHEAAKLAGFPAQPARFAGRTAVMSRAAQALAPRSGRSGIVIQGDTGTGKTALALEVAYTQRRNFRTLIWHQVSPAPAIATALGELATDIDAKIGNLGLRTRLDSRPRFRAFLPVLTELFERERILLVIDDATPLLSAAGSWRDDDMRLLVEALAGHAGLSRVIITTRRPVAGLTAPGMIAEPLPPLTDAESMVLAWDLPGLAGLLDGHAPPLAEQQARGLAARVLTVSRGNPEMLLRADALARDPAVLVRWLLDAAADWPLGQA